MDRMTGAREVRKNPAALLALAWHHAGGGKGAKDVVILPDEDRLALHENGRGSNTITSGDVTPALGATDEVEARYRIAKG